MNVSIIGAGSFGTAMAICMSEKISKDKTFAAPLLLWANSETIDDLEIDDYINKTRENRKYLAGFILPACITCTCCIATACRDSDVILLAVPSAYLKSVCVQMQGWIKPSAVILSLTKGFVFDDGKLLLASEAICAYTGRRVSCMSGANIASDIAVGEYCNSTLAYTDQNSYNIFKTLLHTPTFKLECIDTNIALEVCGALKNIVAIGYGIGIRVCAKTNSLSELLRTGINETRLFLQHIHNIHDEKIFFKSCGFADFFVTCLSGRNSLLGATWDRQAPPDKNLQGPQTAAQVFRLLCEKQIEKLFPFFVNVHRFCEREIEADEFICALHTYTETV